MRKHLQIKALCLFFFSSFFNLQAQDYLHSTEAVSTCSGIYYDVGGAAGNYTNLSGSTVYKTFTSSNANRIRFNFQQLVLETGVDYLTVYDGPNNSYPIVGRYTGNLAPFSVVASGTSFTFGFNSNYQNTYSGWAATIECTTTPLQVYNMTSGTINTCTGIFYDNGGANTDYPNLDDRTQTFCSSNGQHLVAAFNPIQTDFAANDTLFAFDGNTVTSPLLAAYTQNSTIETLRKDLSKLGQKAY